VQTLERWRAAERGKEGRW